MNKITLLFSVFLITHIAEAHEVNELPPFDYINIETMWSEYPSVYLDELGNLRIMKYCEKSILIDRRVKKEVFEIASQSLLKLQFFNIPDNAILKYEQEGGNIVPTNRECDHCPEVYVTFKYKSYVNSSKFEEIEGVKPNVGYEDIKKVLDLILKPFDGVLCEKNG